LITISITACTVAVLALQSNCQRSNPVNTNATTSKPDVLWTHLRNLSYSEFPSNLKKINSAWVLRTLQKSDDQQVEQSLKQATQKDLEIYAYDLRDILHEAICESIQSERFRPHDYE
jgi:hypothetical protein